VKKVSFLKPTMLILVLFLLSTTIIFADTHTNRQEFQYMSTQEVTLHSDNEFIILDIDPSTFATMKTSLRDLRLFAKEQELGYARLPLGISASPVNETKLEILNQGMLENGNSSFVMVMPEGGSKGQFIRVKLDREPYLVKGTLYGSQDNRNWERIQSVTLFGIDHRYNQISLEGLDYDFLKIDYRQPSGETLKVKEAVWIAPNQHNEKDIFSSEQVSFEVTEDVSSKETYVIADLQHINRLSSEWEMDTSEKGFHRHVILEGSNDRQNWSHLDSTYIYRGVEMLDENLAIQYKPSYYRYLRLTIFNEDNAPLNVNSVLVKTHPIRVLVKVPLSLQGSTVQFTAYWGNEQIKAPSYDVVKLIDSIDYEKYPIAHLLNKANNPNYNPESGTPLTERFPLLLPIGLILAVVIVGYILFRNLKQMKL
jgi:hypothetical protein